MHKDDERLINLRYTLGGDPEEHRVPRFCKENLKLTFPDALDKPNIRKGFLADYKQMTQELLRSDSTYRAWGGKHVVTDGDIESGISSTIMEAGKATVQG
ncbi:MAG: hypothetical protein Q9176_001493 [Flavoplaca citrina]